MIKLADWKSGGREKFRAGLEDLRALDDKKKRKLAAVIAVLLLVVLALAGLLHRRAGAAPEATGDVSQILSSQKAQVEDGQAAGKDSFGNKLSGALSGWQLPFQEDISKIVSQRQSRTIQVPGDADSIQKAIDQAVSGDLVKVSAGEYKGIIVMKDGVSVVGESAESTILDGDRLGNVVTFKNINNQDTRLENFTIKNAKQDLSGILIDDSSPLINRNIVLQNDYDIYIKGESSPTVQRNQLSQSKAGVQIFNLEEAQNSHPAIADNLIFGSKKGVNIYKGSATLEHNTISFNSNYGSDSGATFGVYLASASATIRNNIVTDNGSCEICGGIYVDAGSQNVTIDHNDLWNNQNNFVCFGGCQMADSNLSSDPAFENGLLFDFKLKPDSSLLTAGMDGQRLGSRI